MREYEYENQWFQAGKPKLLLNIRRRNQESTKRKRGEGKLYSNGERSRMVTELEILRENIYLLRLDSQKLKEEKGDFENRIAKVEKQVNSIESNVQKMIKFFGKILNPSSVQQIVENAGEEQELESHDGIKSTGNSSEDQSPPEKQQTVSSAADDDDESEAIATENGDALMIMKKLFEDDFDLEKVHQLAQKHPQIDMELEEMRASKIIMMEMEDVIANEPITDVKDHEFQLWP